MEYNITLLLIKTDIFIVRVTARRSYAIHEN